MTTDPGAPSPVDAPPSTPPLPPPPAEPPVTDPGIESAAAPAPARKTRRPRPVLLLVSGLVLGTAAGGGIGYAVQAGRPPTPLPPIQVALPTYPSEVLDPAVAAASAPTPLAIDGDLRKLLITAPSGSKPWDDYPETPSWITVGERAEQSGNTVNAFKNLNETGFRRAVEVDWKQSDLLVRVSLVQYSADFADEADRTTFIKAALKPFADEANGGYMVDDEPSYWAETTEKFYLGVAYAQRGTVLMEIKVFGTRPVDPEVVKDLAKKQWERLV
ncbi:hypothetical protein ABTX81_01130 [Kitasatospora sp. NPDC097605]|uniref:hypothetical protein n=1 Tax=Kitasatospora sp. NPDC097605 TaxID=3157226 RepID=UPI003323BA1A